MGFCKNYVWLISQTSVPKRGLIAGGRGDEIELGQLHVGGDVHAPARRPLVEHVVAGVADYRGTEGRDTD